MEFLVSLIRVRASGSLTPDEQEELEENCRHVDGPWWIFEGDEDALNVRVRVAAEGVTPGLHPDDIPPGKPIIDHAIDIFGLPCWPPPPGWER